MARTPGAWLVLVLAGCAAVESGAPVARGLPVEPAFVFQSHPWVNLHHFLRAEARRAARGAKVDLAPQELSEGELVAWSAGLDAYAGFAQRSLLFDEELVALHVALAGVAPETRVLPPDVTERIGEPLARALEGALPIFLERRWPARTRANEAWIAATRPEVERVAGSVLPAIARALEVPWPSQPILVDVTSETGPNLAYTTSAAPPGYAGLAAISPTVSGAAAVECAFHEAMHVLDAGLVRWVEEESARQGIEPPPELWHALLFYTAGELTRRALGRAGTFREDLERGFAADLPALDAHWLPYLDGVEPLDVALRGVVREAAVALSPAARAVPGAPQPSR